MYPYELVNAEGLASYNIDDLDNLTAIARRKIGNGQVIILGTVPEAKALLKLVNRTPIAQASSNVDLVERTGSENGIIAMEIEGKDGYICLDKEYYDILNEKTVSGRIELKPYSAYILKEIK